METETVSSRSEDDADEPETPQQVTAKRKAGMAVLTNYFAREPGANTSSSAKAKVPSSAKSAPGSDSTGNPRKRKLQKSEHYCVYKKCLKSLSRGNKYSKMRHKENQHKNDPLYDEDKHILPGDHSTVLKLLRERRCEVAAGSSGNGLLDATEDPENASQTTQREEYEDNRERTGDEDEELMEGEEGEKQRGVASECDDDESVVESRDDADVEAEIREGAAVVTHDTGADAEADVGESTSLIAQCQLEYYEEDDTAEARSKENESNRLVQSTLSFKCKEKENMQRKNEEKLDVNAINEKLDLMLEKLTISSSHRNEELPEAVESVNIVKAAKTITETYGSGITFIPGEGEGIVRCDACFAYNCENDPSLQSKDPFFLGHTNNASHGGKSLALGLIIDSEKKKKYLQGHSQEWSRFKKTLIDHMSFTSSKSGGTQHYQAVIAKKRRDKREKSILNVVCNQLKTAVTVVKSKTAALHYEDLIGLLHSCGAAVGNLGHGRKQINQMLKAFQAYFYMKLRKHIQTPLPSTGIPPHFSTTSDKSTPIRVTNHAVMVVLMVEGEKVAIPIAAPPVYDFEHSEVIGGDAGHLADQVIYTLTKTAKIPETSLRYLMSHQADGQYQAREFGERLKERIFGVERPDEVDKFFVIPWDTAHWMDCCLTDVRVKEENGQVLRRLILRVNKFHSMFGRGRGYAEYKGLTLELELGSFTTSTYSTTRFASSAFETFEKVYKNYEGLAKTYERLRETTEVEEETRYMIKGRDFCVDLCGLLDILSPLMEMMVRLQALNSLIWSITKLWPRVRQKLVKVKQEIEDQIYSVEPQFDETLLPKLNKHFPFLNEECAYDCTFQNVSLTPGWMVVDEKDVPAADKSTKGRKKSKVYEWIDRSPDDCLTEMVSFIETLLVNMDQRYTSSVTEAAHILGKCLDIPGIYTHVQGTSQQLTATQIASIQEHGKKEFHDFFSYVSSLPHIKDLCKADPSMKFVGVLAPSIHSLFKSTIVEVIWRNLGNCRSVWFPPMSSPVGTVVKHGDSLSAFSVKSCPNDIDDFCLFQYENGCVTARFDEKAAFCSMYTNEEIYNRLGQEMCVVLDVALAMSGSEAVVESYYSVMGSQTKAGGQDSDTLVGRTNLDWCFPKSTHCEETIKEIAKLYIKGDKEFDLKPHQIPVFVDERGRAISKYSQGGKVLDRLSKKDELNIFLSDKDK